MFGSETENLIQSNNKSGKSAPHQTLIKNPRKDILESERALLQRYHIGDLKNTIHQKTLWKNNFTTSPRFLA